MTCTIASCVKSGLPVSGLISSPPNWRSIGSRMSTVQIGVVYGHSMPMRLTVSPSLTVSLAAMSVSSSHVMGLSFDGQRDAGGLKVGRVVDQAEGVVLGDAAGVNLAVHREGVERALGEHLEELFLGRHAKGSSDPPGRRCRWR